MVSYRGFWILEKHINFQVDIRHVISRAAVRVFVAPAFISFSLHLVSRFAGVAAAESPQLLCAPGTCCSLPMCIVFFCDLSLDEASPYRYVLASNRDEVLSRPSSAAAALSDDEFQRFLDAERLWAFGGEMSLQVACGLQCR